MLPYIYQHISCFYKNIFFRSVIVQGDVLYVVCCLASSFGTKNGFL